MICGLIGYNDVSFTDRESGQVISGTTLYIALEKISHGYKAEKVFVSSAKLPAGSLEGCTEVDINFGPNGKVVSCFGISSKGK